ncbi:adenine-specific DNA glycosylase [Helicobacter cetorum]|uniref:adenine-specific DNA glycosylase n=1 Tax=Helicobacter cetorum TaxID=138563 RepID=UPI000CF151E7|nr:adenine-specific DNA glycosylase [Helicobacter cetorum]
MKALHNALLKWYEEYGRKDLPFRNLKGINAPYEIYISEVMSQQTQINTVVERYYFPFLKAFPTLKDLANAPLDKVLLLWRGLGYYSRAKNLKRSAEICVKEYHSQLPNDYQSLLKLPGVGAYTANAILCFGFREKVACVDANVKRVLLRLFSLDLNTSTKDLQIKANEFLNLNESFNHNQALIDLGALVCTPKPKCEICCLNDYCLGKNSLEKHTLKKKQEIIQEERYLGIVIEDKKIALEKIEQKLYFGMHHFPSLKENLEFKLPFLGTIKHSHTKFKLNLNLYLASIKDLENPINFYSSKDLETLPISSMTLKILKFLKEKNLFIT